MKGKLCVAVIAISACLFGQTDEVAVAGGSVVTGRVVAIDAEGVEIEAVGGGKTRTPWAAVANVRVTQPIKLSLANGDQITGTIRGRNGDQLAIEVGSFGALQIPIGALAAPPPPPKKDAPPDPNKPPLTAGDWKGKVALSGTVRQGNVDSVLAALHAEAEKSWDADKVSLAADVLYGKTDGNLTASSFGGKARLDHFYDATLYTYASAEALHDEIQNIDVRAILNVGVGDVLWSEGPDRNWSVEGGIAGIYEKGAGRSTDISPAGRAATVYKDVFFTDLHFEQDFEILVPFDDPGRYLAKARSIFTVPISESIRMRTSLELNYQGDPPPNTERLDILGLVGLEYQF